MFAMQDVTSVSKRKNVGFPNSIQVVWDCGAGEKQEFFTSFLHRREAYRMLVTAWSNCRSFSPAEGPLEQVSAGCCVLVYCPGCLPHTV